MKVDLRTWQSLVRFAAVALVDRTGRPRAEIARGMNKKPPSFHQALFGRSGRVDEVPSKPFCQELQRYLQTRPPEGSAADGLHRRFVPLLTNLYEELGEYREPDSGVSVHAAWFPELCRTGPARSAVEVVVRGEALRDLIKDLPSRLEAERLFVDHRIQEDVRQTIMDLLSVVGSPPSRGIPATNLLARLGAVALPEIENEIYQSPVGFRGVRVVGRMLWHVKLRRKRRERNELPGTEDPELLRDIEGLLKLLYNKEPVDPYPARSFYIEALRYAPPEWDRWVVERLATRALDTQRPVRERVYAARLAKLKGYDDNAMKVLIDRLRQEGRERREDGLLYAAAVLDAVEGRDRGIGWLDDDGQVPRGGQLREWPPGRSEFEFVNDVLAALDKSNLLPPSVKGGTKVLVSEALLGIDGTYRRRACDVLHISQMAAPAAEAVATLFTKPRDRVPRWLQEHAAFVLGYLQQAQALEALGLIVSHWRDFDPTVVHAAAWGLGDTFGREGWTEYDGLPIKPLKDLATVAEGPPRWAATYALAVTRRTESQGTLSELLTHQRADRITRGLARWGIWLHDAEKVRGRKDASLRIPDSRTFIKS